jgi:hypothetical protein
MICGTNPSDNKVGLRFEDSKMSIFTTTKLTVTIAAFAVLAGCGEPLDFDLRGGCYQQLSRYHTGSRAGNRHHIGSACDPETNGQPGACPP